ncbi:MAG: DUF302 domain-containing protein [Vulcanimicrobiaceae bacterium]
MMTPHGVNARQSAHGFAATVEAARNVLTALGQTIFAEIDQAAAARSVGLQLRPTMLFVFGNPKAGTGLMIADPLVGLELPLKLLVWQGDDGATNVAYRSVTSLIDAYGITGIDDHAAQIDRALATLVNNIVTY